MSSNNQSNINETFIIQPIYQQSDVISACTAVYTNNIFSCSGNTSISMSTNEVNFNNKQQGTVQSKYKNHYHNHKLKQT